MPRAEKPALLDWLYRREFDQAIQVRQVVTDGARAVLGKSAQDAEVYAEVNCSIFWNYILKNEDNQERRGLSRAFKVVDPSLMVLSWFGIGDSFSSEAHLGKLRTRLRHRPAFLRMMDGLDDRQYEALACVVSQLGGASNVSLTPPGNEGGIDFFALIPTYSRCHLFSGGIAPLRIVGQCKQYNSAVPESSVKEFVETLRVVQYRGDTKIENLIPSWFHAFRGPIVGLMIAHSGFQSGAETKARNHGIILADTLDLAEIACLSRQFPVNLDAEERASCCLSRVAALLQTGV